MPTLYCPKCGYNLHGLTENRCPECGEGFDREQLMEVQRCSITTGSVVLQLVLVPLGISAAVIALLFLGVATSSDPMGTLFSTFMVGGGIIFAHSLVLARPVVQAKHALVGRSNTSWMFRSVGPCFALFMAVEAALVLVYAIGGCTAVVVALEVFA